MSTLIVNSITDTGNNSLLGRRNLLINGAMQVWQRGTGTFNTNNAFTADRIRIYNASVTQSTDAPSGFNYSVKNTTSSLGGWLFQSGVELDVTGQAGILTGDLTFSFYGKFDSGLTVTVSSWFADSSGGVNQSAAVWATSVTGTGDWERYVVNVNSSVTPNATNKCLRWVIYDNNSQSTTTYAITGVQLEVGSVATPFEHRSYGEELARCQRYYEKSYSANTYPGASGVPSGFLQLANNGVITNAIPGIKWMVTKRVSPTVTIYNGVNGTSGQVYREVDAASITVTPQYIGDTGYGRLVLSTSKEDMYIFHYTADAEL